ncbi:MAG: hypothetical protein NEA02_05410 [Thermoanaerobaculia bacterium]|nr:hypothetical protein [Thermoanaerobaculia bacterium]
MTSYVKKSERVKSLANTLASHHSPRFELTVILALTAGVGVLSSRIMLWLGVLSMALRYPMAAVVAYTAFLAFVGVWVRAYATAKLLPHSLLRTSPPPEPVTPELSIADAADALNLLSLFEEGCFIVVVAIGVGALFVGLFATVSDAPALLSELLLETSILGVLYPALRSTPRRGWLAVLLRRTVVPLFVLGVVLAVTGSMLQSYVPHAVSIRDVYQHWRTTK